MKKNILTAIILFFVTSIIYIATAHPSVYIGDSGEIATATYFLGIAHSTGFPVYMLLAKLSSYALPFFEFAFRLNIFSALCAAATTGVLFLILRKIKIDFWASVAASLALSFGYAFWTHAGTIQVYSLTALFFALSTFTLLHWLETGKDKYFYCLAIICGLGAGTHITFLLILPFIFLFTLLKDKSLITIKRFLLFVAVAAATYSYLPIRARMSPEFNWGNPGTAENFINYITQSDWSEKIGTRNSSSWVAMLKETGRLFVNEFTWLGFIFIFIGAVVASRKQKQFFYGGILVVALNILLMGNYGNNQDIFILWRYFLPSYIVMAIFLGMAFNWLSFFVPQKAKIVFLVLPIIIFIFHFNDLNNRNNTIVQKTVQDIFAVLPQGSVFIADGDTVTGAALYEQKVLGKRNDLLILNDSWYTGAWYQEQEKKEMEEKNIKFADNFSFLIKENSDRKFYALTNSNSFLKINYDFYPEGIIYLIKSKSDQVAPGDLKEKNFSIWEQYDLWILKDKKFKKDNFTNEIVSLYTGALNNLGAYLTNNGYVPDGIKYFDKSLEIRENKLALYNLAGIYNALGDKAKALEYKNRFDALK